MESESGSWIGDLAKRMDETDLTGFYELPDLENFVLYKLTHIPTYVGRVRPFDMNKMPWLPHDEVAMHTPDGCYLVNYDWPDAQRAVDLLVSAVSVTVEMLIIMPLRQLTRVFLASGRTPDAILISHQPKKWCRVRRDDAKQDIDDHVAILAFSPKSKSVLQWAYLDEFALFQLRPRYSPC